MANEVPRRVLKPVYLPCPLCRERRASITLSFGQIGDGDNEEFQCGDCERNFGIADVVAIIREWGPFVAWLESIPQPE